MINSEKQNWNMDSIMEHIIINYRWVFVMFLLPISLCYDIFYAVRSFVIFTLNSAPKKHLEKVKDVQKQVKAWRDSGMDKPMCTARPGKTMHERLLIMEFITFIEFNYNYNTIYNDLLFCRMANNITAKYGI